MDFDQTFTDTLLVEGRWGGGGREEVIRFWWPWSHFQGHTSTWKLQILTKNSLSAPYLLNQMTGFWPNFIYYAPPPESGGVLCYTFRNFECPSVRLSVRPSVHPSAPTTVLVSATPPTVLGQSFWNFTGVLRIVWRYAYCFFQNPEIIFYHFFPIFNLDIFRALILQICIWSMYLVSATPPTVFGESFWNFTGVLRMVWRYAYCFFRILKLFFITFFPFLT